MQGTIVYVTQTGAFLDRGRDQGVARGDTVTVLRGRTPLRLQVTAVSDQAAYCAWPPKAAMAPTIALSARVRIDATAARVPPPGSKVRKARVVAFRQDTLGRAWNDVVRTPAPLVAYRPEGPTLPDALITPGRKLTAAVAHESFGQVSGGRGRFEEERFFLATALGEPGSLGLDVDLDGAYFTVRPQQPRFATDRPFQVSAHRAQVRYLSPEATFLAGFGRMPSRSKGSSRPLDGLELAYRLRSGVSAGAVAGFVPDVQLQPSTRRFVAGGYFVADREFGPTTRGRFDVEPLITLHSDNKDVGAMEIVTSAELETLERYFGTARARVVRDLRPESAGNPIYLGHLSVDAQVALVRDLRVGAGYRRQDRRAEDLATQGSVAAPIQRLADSQLDGQIDWRTGRFQTTTMVGLNRLEDAPTDAFFAREELALGPFGGSAVRTGVAYLYSKGAFDYHQPEAFLTASPGERVRLHARYSFLADAAPGRRLYGHTGYLVSDVRLSSSLVLGANARYITLEGAPDSLRALAYLGKDF